MDNSDYIGQILKRFSCSYNIRAEANDPKGLMLLGLKKGHECEIA